MKKKKKISKKHAKKQNKKNKILLETSIQITKVFDDSIREKLTNLSSTNDFFSSYFVLYEFKTGLIKTLIDFYLRVKICDDVSSAIVSWSNSFKIRELKNKNLLEALMLQLFKSIDGTTTDRYLAQVEAVFENKCT